MTRSTWSVACIGLVAVAGCGGGSNAITGGTTGPDTDSTSTQSSSRQFSGGRVDPLVPAPELGLRTWNGKLVHTADYRGKVMLVTFLYTRCPDVCPLITDNLVRVKDRLGPDGKRLAIVAVSVDPGGDHPKAVQAFLRNHRALGKVDYLIGSRTALEATWAKWGIAARVSKDHPELIEHSGVIWGVDTHGRRATFYPASGFDVADIEGDVRLLLEG